jgi:MFS transporter, MCT family, solute carrier family 16 (monocarboxylic acid transporters), member 10
MTESLLTNNHHAVIVPAKPKEKKVDTIEPPDGGARAFLVMISAFLCNGILFGIINTYSVIYVSLQKQLTESGDESASSKACKFRKKHF